MKPDSSPRRRFVYAWHVSACIALVLLAALLGRAAASGVVRDSIGAISSGRGGANIAHFDNGPVLLSNPAAMVNVRGPELFELDVDTVFTDLDYRDPENFGATDGAASPLPALTYIKTSPDHEWAAGIGVYAPAGFTSDWNLNNPLLGNRSYSSFGALIKIIPGAAVRVTDELSLGATLGLAVSHVQLDTPFFLQTGPLAGVPAILNLRAQGNAPTWSLGAQYKLTDTTMLGLVYSSEDRFKLDGQADAVLFVPGPSFNHFDSKVDLVWPQSVGGGISQVIAERHRVSLDLVWYDWSHAFDRVDLKFGPVLGDSFPLNWDDGLSTRAGYEYFAANGGVYRAGYIHNSANIPSSTLTPLIPATMEHSFTVGYGWLWSDWHIDLAYQFAWSPDRTVGTSALVGGDFSNSVSRSQAHWAGISFLRQF